MLNLATIGPGIARFGGRLLILGKQYAPQIMTYSGIGGFIATVVYACKATTKAEQILTERDEKLGKVEECVKDPDIEYSEADMTKDIQTITVQTRWALVKCYAPVVTLGLASMALILGGHHIIQMRSAAYCTAYKASEKAFRAYREAVAKKYGEDPNKTILDEQIPDVIEAEHKRLEANEGKKPKQVIPVGDINSALWCKRTSKCWNDNAPRLNCFFLQKIQDQCNDKLLSRGYLFLNEVRSMLGLDYIPAGQYVGWILDRHSGGDNYVDFLHIHDPIHEPSQSVKDFFDLKNTDEVILDFNHDGDIHMDVASMRSFA